MPVKSVVILYEFSFFYSLKSIFLGTQLKFPHALRVYQASLIWSCPISIVFKILQIVNSALYEIMGGNPISRVLYQFVCMCVCACVITRELLKDQLLFKYCYVVQVSCLDQSNELINWAFILNKKLSRCKLKSLNLLPSVPINIFKSCLPQFF